MTDWKHTRHISYDHCHPYPIANLASWREKEQAHFVYIINRSFVRQASSAVVSSCSMASFATCGMYYTVLPSVVCSQPLTPPQFPILRPARVVISGTCGRGAQPSTYNQGILGSTLGTLGQHRSTGRILRVKHWLNDSLICLFPPPVNRMTEPRPVSGRRNVHLRTSPRDYRATRGGA